MWCGAEGRYQRLWPGAGVSTAYVSACVICNLPTVVSFPLLCCFAVVVRSGLRNCTEEPTILLKSEYMVSCGARPRIPQIVPAIFRPFAQERERTVPTIAHGRFAKTTCKLEKN